MKSWQVAFFDSIKEDIIPLEDVRLPYIESPEKILINRELNQEHLKKETKLVLSLIFSAPKEVIETVESLRKFLMHEKNLKHRTIQKAFKDIRRILNEC